MRILRSFYLESGSGLGWEDLLISLLPLEESLRIEPPSWPRCCALENAGVTPGL